MKWLENQGQSTGPDASGAGGAQRPKDFNEVMFNYQWLHSTRLDRRHARRALLAYCNLLARGFPASLKTLLAPVSDPADRQALLDGVRARWQRGARLKALYFADRGVRSPNALYVPAVRTIYLNVSQAVGDPGRFADAFEHELWHMLLPSVTPETVGTNPWWEGFDEAISEIWSAALRRQWSSPPLSEGPVAYPVLAAYASLFFAADRGAVLDWLDRRLTTAAFLDRLAGASSGPDSLRCALAASYRNALRVSPRRKARIEAILADWNWTEDDGTPPRIDCFLLKNRITAARIDAQYGDNRAYLMAFLDAVTVTQIRDLLHQWPRHRLLKAVSGKLPNCLVQNLKRVISYSRDPDMPLL